MSRIQQDVAGPPSELLAVAKAIARHWGYRWSPCDDCRRKGKLGVDHPDVISLACEGTRLPTGRYNQCLGAWNLDPNDCDETPTRESCYDLASIAIRALDRARASARPTESQPLAPFSASTPDIIHGGRFVAGETPTIDMVPGWPDVPVARALKMEGEMK